VTLRKDSEIKEYWIGSSLQLNVILTNIVVPHVRSCLKLPVTAWTCSFPCSNSTSFNCSLKSLCSIQLSAVSQIIWNFFNSYRISGHGRMGCDTVYWCGRIPTFRRSLLPPSPGKFLKIGQEQTEYRRSAILT